MSVKTEYKVSRFEFVLHGGLPVTVDRLRDGLPDTIKIETYDHMPGENGRDVFLVTGTYGPVLGNWPSDAKRLIVGAIGRSSATLEEKSFRVIERWPREFGPSGPQTRHGAVDAFVE